MTYFYSMVVVENITPRWGEMKLEVLGSIRKWNVDWTLALSPAVGLTMTPLLCPEAAVPLSMRTLE